jgi:hypothetical protein
MMSARTSRHRLGWRLFGAGCGVWLQLAQAAATDVCVTATTPDGFVAVRAAPRAEAAIVVRAKPGEALVIQKTAGGEDVRSGQWLRVFHFPDAVIPERSDLRYRQGKLGWMHRRFVIDCG